MRPSWLSWKTVVVAGGFAISLVLGLMWFRRTTPVATAVSSVERMFVPPATKLFGKDHLRVLLIGLDYDYDKLDQETSKSSRSDIIMALDLDLKNHRVNEISIPRDMIATLPNGQKAKINQAQSEGGIAESKAVIADWLGIAPFDRYVVMRIDTSKDVIDAIGGIDIAVENSDALRGTGPNGPIDYDDNWGHLHIHLKPGTHHLDGEHAVAYARFRHDWCSDPCRIMRQQQVVRAIVERVSRDRFNTFTHARALLDVVRKDVQTDFTTQEQISSALAFSHVTPRDIRTAQVPYTSSIMLPDYGDSLVPNDVEKRRLVADFFRGDTTDTVANVRVARTSGVRIRVENGTTVSGLAGRVANDLRRKGFNVYEVGDAPTANFAVTEIESVRATSAVSQLVRKELGPNATIEERPAMWPVPQNAADMTIVLGRDIVGAKR